MHIRSNMPDKQVLIRRRGSSKKILCYYTNCANECDFALLSVNDDSFWEADECKVAEDQISLHLRRLQYSTVQYMHVRTSVLL
mmetsp:Transcript_24649/g.24962  ORF Transcript_24649/g.24962 Transcript_24649/m.24962 type:complete len:83 (-) Transcript_24649:84-332(-)